MRQTSCKRTEKNLPMLRRGTLLLVLLLICGCCSAALAQTITGSVTGTVTDSGGSAVVGAAVSAIATATGTVSRTQTNGNGVYSLHFLPVGQYTVNIEAKGFQSSTIGPFELEVAQQARIDAKLNVGNTVQNVVVSAAEAILNVENATTGDTITENTASEMPLQGRNFSSLTLAAAGAIQPNPNALNSVARSNYNGGFFVNGNREQTNNYTLDGADINEAIDNYIGYSPNVDAIGEMKIITGNATAEYGNANGGQVVMITKSGTNQFHGNASWFLENQNLNANAWANKHFGTINPTTPFNRSIFAGTLGGPVRQNKLFFFVDYQGARQHTSSVVNYTVPTPVMRSGTVPIKQSDGTVTQQTFNITSKAAQYLLAHPELYPLPNTAGSGTSLFPSNNYTGREKQFVTNNQGDVKIDWQIRSNDLVSGRFSIGRELDGTPTASIPTENVHGNNNPYTGFIVNWTHTFSPTLVSESRAGVGRTRYINQIADPSGAWGTTGNQKLGIPGTQIFPGFSGFLFSGGTNVSTIGPPFGGNVSDSIVNALTYGENLTWQRGRHALKFGGQALRYQENRYCACGHGVLGSFSYNGQFTGDSWSDFLTDQAWSDGQAVFLGFWGQRQWRDALFVQDDFKLRPNLTVNLGMRWEYDQPLYEVNNKQSNLNIHTGTISYAGKNGASRALYSAFFGGFMPRVGFAFSPKRFDDRFVVRGGYGITNFLEGTGANLRLTLNAPFFIDATQNALSGPGLMVENGFVRPADPNVYAGTVRAWDPNLKAAIVQQYNLTTETQVATNTSVTVAYVGQMGDHLVDPREGNQKKCPGCPLPVTSLQPNLAAITNVSYTESEGTMNYNALQVTGRQHANNGLELLTSYTFSKTLSNNLGYYGAGGVSSMSAYWQDAYDGQADYGLAFFDAEQIFSFVGSYELPFGRGKLFGGSWNRAEDTLIGGWKLAATASLHSGFPVTMSSTEYYHVNQRTNRANHYGKLKIRSQSVNHWFGVDPSATPCKTDTYNGTCAYGEESSTGFGTAKVSSERAPSYKGFDLAASKAFAITEGSRFVFRADIFNILNTTSLGAPNANISSATWGQITDTNSTERQIQLALKYTF
jgi:hypothetical protein